MPWFERETPSYLIYQNPSCLSMMSSKKWRQERWSGLRQTNAHAAQYLCCCCWMYVNMPMCFTWSMQACSCAHEVFVWECQALPYWCYQAWKLNTPAINICIGTFMIHKAAVQTGLVLHLKWIPVTCAFCYNHSRIKWLTSDCLGLMKRISAESVLSLTMFKIEKTIQSFTYLQCMHYLPST